MEEYNSYEQQQYQEYYQQNYQPDLQVSYNNSNIQQQGLKLFEIPIFTIFNPKNAVITFAVDCKSNALKIKMAPAIPNNPAIGTKGPVPKNVKVYDYDKMVVSNFSDVEAIDFLNFLKCKFLNSANEYGAWIASSTSNLTIITQYINSLNNQIPNNDLLMNISKNLEDIKSYYSKFNENIENQIGLYRKSMNGDKAWNFVYDPGTHMLHINVIYGKNKENRINSTISAKMSLRLMNIIDSYVKGFSSNQLLTNLSVELSNDTAVANEKLTRIESMLNLLASKLN